MSHHSAETSNRQYIQYKVHALETQGETVIFLVMQYHFIYISRKDFLFHKYPNVVNLLNSQTARNATIPNVQRH